MDPTIPQRIRYFAKLSGKSQAQIAAEIGKTPSAVSQWMTDSTPDKKRPEPTHKNLASLCRVLGITLATFFGPIAEVPEQDGEASDSGDPEGEGGKTAAASA